jgi:hypothetical protein
MSEAIALQVEDYFARMSRTDEPSAEVISNAGELIDRVNTLLAQAAHEGLEEAAQPKVNSGWRSAEYNATVPNAAPKSKHITGQAIDLADPEGALDHWCVTNLHLLEDVGLWLEHPLATKGWCHLQSVAPRSGNRMFYP